MSESPVHPPRRRRWPWFAALGLLFLILLPVLLLSLQPVRVWILEGVLRRALGAEPELQGIYVGNPAQLERIEMRDTPLDPQEPPILIAEKVRIGYGWNPFAPRPLKEFSAASLKLALSDVQSGSNYDFIKRKLAQPSTGGGSATALPERFFIADFSLEVERPAWRLGLGGISGEGILTSTQEFSANIEGETTALRWHTPAGDGDVTGQVRLTAKGDAESMSAQGEIDLPDVLQLPLQLKAGRSEEGEFHVSTQGAMLHRAFWPELLSDLLPFPIDFHRLEVRQAEVRGRRAPALEVTQASLGLVSLGLSLSGAAVDPAAEGRVQGIAAREDGQLKAALLAEMPALGHLDAELALLETQETRHFHLRLKDLRLDAPPLLGWLFSRVPYPMSAQAMQVGGVDTQGIWQPGQLQISETPVQAALQGLVVGDATKPWYTGDASADGTASYDGAPRFDGEVKLGNAAAAAVTLALEEKQLDLALEVPVWTRQQLAVLLPDRLDSMFARLEGVQQLQGSVALKGAAPEFALTAALDAGLRGMGADVQVEGVVNLSTPPLFKGDFNARSKASGIQGDIIVEDPERYQLDLKLEKASPYAWIHGWSNISFPEDLQTSLTGTAEVDVRTGGMTFEVDLQSPGLGYGTFVFPAENMVTAEGKLSLDGSKLSIAQLQLAAGEGFRGLLEDGSFTLSPMEGTVKTSGEAELSYLGGLFGFGDAFGTVQFSGNTGISGGKAVTGTLSLTSDSVGYGDWATPYGSEVTLASSFRYETEQKLLTAEKLTVNLGEATQVEAASATVQTGTLELKEVAITTDLAPVVAMGFLGGAEGVTANFTLPFLRRQGEAWQLTVRPTVEAAKLALPKTLARLENSAFSGDFTYDGEIQGTGTLRAESLVAGGVTVRGVDTEVRGDGQDLLLENIESTVFNGRVRGTVRAGVAREAMPVQVDLEMENIDLAAFTTEFKPPRLSMTGLASGTARVVFSREGIQDFEAKLVSDENFTMNRDMLLLLAEYMKEKVSANKRMQRVLKEVIGEGEQRPFEGAELDLGFENNLITGVLILRSKALNFTIDLTSDPESFIEALRVRQGGAE